MKILSLQGSVKNTMKKSYLEVVGGIWVFVTGNNFRCHPVGSANESIPPAHCSVKLGTYAKVHYEGNISE